MERICPNCGKLLQEHDFLCPDCGAIYEAPVCGAPKQECLSIPAVQKRKIRRWVIAGVCACLLLIVCLRIWNPFRQQMLSSTEQPAQHPAATLFSTTTAATTTVPIFPTTVLPTEPKQTFDPTSLAAQIPEDVLLQMKQTAIDQYHILFYEAEDVTIDRVFGIFEDGKYAVIIDGVPKYWAQEKDKEYGMTFLYPDKNAILVYSQGKFDRIWSLTMEETAVVFENYYNAYPHIPKPEPELYIPPCDPIAMAAQIPEDMQQQIRQAYVDMASRGDAADDYRLRSYGIFGDVYAVDFVWLLGGGEGWYQENINGLIFYQVIWIYADGALYELPDAFAQQIITAEELQLIHTNVYGVNTH